MDKMAKLRVRCHRDDDLRNRKVEIWKGRKKVTVKYDYSPVGDTFGFSLEGRKHLLPSVPELLQIVDAKRLDRIGTIELIDLITRIALIDEITKIGEITTIRDLAWSSPSSLLVNFAFHQGLTGWEVIGDAQVIDGASVGWTGNVCHFRDSPLTTRIEQMLPFGFDPAWGTIKFWMRSPKTTANLLRAKYFYTDGTDSTELFAVSVINTWELKTLSPTKAVMSIQIMKTIALNEEFYIAHFFVVF